MKSPVASVVKPVLRASSMAAALAVFAAPVKAAPGEPQGPEFLVSAPGTGTEIFTTAACDAAGECLLAWVHEPAQGDSSPAEIRGRRYASDGSPISAETTLAVSTKTGSENLRQLHLAMDAGGDFVLAWSDRASLVPGPSLRWFRADATARSAVVHFAGGVPSSVAMDTDGDTVVLDHAGSCPSLYATVSCSTQLHARRYSVDGVFRDTRLVQTATTSLVGGRDIAFDTVAESPDGSFVVSWLFSQGSISRVMARSYSAQGKVRGPAFIVQDQPASGYFQSTAIAAGSSDHYLVTWTESSPLMIRARALRGDGSLPGTAQYLPFPQSSRASQIVGNAADQFALLAEESAYSADEGPGNKLYSLLLGADATPLSVVVSVGSSPGNDRYFENFAIDGSGNFVVSWNQFSTEGSRPAGVYAQRFSGP